MLSFCCQPLNKFVCNPHKYWILMIVWIIQTRKVWFDVGYFNVVIYTVLY